MIQSNKVIGWLLVLIGLFLNPYILSLLFSNDGSITSTSIWTVILFVDFLFVVFGVSLIKSSAASRLSNIGLLILSVVLTIALSISADQFYGNYLMLESTDLLFPAFSKAKHNTSEFELDVQINNLGFRGANAKTEKSRKRVLLIGDSFTFGWGVELEKTWASLLCKSYPEIEFLNLGQGGNHPGDYVRILKKALPVLQPDLVLVCVLQGNDIHQLMRVIEFEESEKSTTQKPIVSESNRAKLNRYLRLVFPHFSKRFQPSVSIQERWITDAQTLLNELTEEQLQVYNSINESLRFDFENGMLNPSLIYESIHHPNWIREAADTSNELCNKSIIRLRDHLIEMDSICVKSGSKMIVVSVPNRPYGFTSELKSLNELGYETAGCDTLNGALPTKLACLGAKVNCLFPAMNGDSLFYPYDGHWNANGNRIFAQQLSLTLDRLPEWKHFLTSSSF